MRYRSLGNSGLQVSVVGIGCNNFGGRLDADGTREVVHAALDEGITLFDTADVYGNKGGSEQLLGEAVAGHRDQVVLATKFAGDMGYGPAAGARGGRAYIRRAIEESLRRLRTDYVDLYQIHNPDPKTPIAETLSALDELVKEGKVRYVGSSNFGGWRIAEAAHVAKELGITAFVSAQNHWSLLERGAEAEVVPAARHYGVGMLPYFPLARGLLSGKVRRGEPIPSNSRLRDQDQWVADRIDRTESLRSWAESHGRTLLEVGIGGLDAQPGCGSVIAGAMNAEQVKANAAAGEWIPTAAELAELNELVPPPKAGR
ncbi:aldo/keto reductase [Tenggerimyces flavus]|uniref:Aldo/keto reductase n=1 Tax=Tenggerimyces flavus TaxID=1708749 RepID=A0ABV7YF19_9ACTN|nr:aldo/keto reductase [Tenggerimyces flavus]MBM7786065.1 aryl-alcohol dehydrogenase-like predicted oxidoreductase [Tenggerimyces flavus]